MANTETLGASLMFAELATMLEPTISRLDTYHPGLSPKDRETAATIRAILHGVEEKSKDMAKDLLIASSGPIADEADVEGPI